MNLNFTRPNQVPEVLPVHILLASQSMGRKHILDKLGVRFRTVVSHVNEEQITDKDPIKTIKRRAQAKLNEIIAHPAVYSITENTKTLVIAADSMVVLGKKAYGKAEHRDHAKEMLKALMGKPHTFVTAVSAAYMEGTTVKKHWDSVTKTKVTLKKLPQMELDLYVTRYDFTRFAGGYALQETPWDLVTKIEGSYTNVIGLPLEVLLPILKKLEVIALPPVQ